MTQKEHNKTAVLLLLAAMGLNSLPLGYTIVVLPIYLNDLGFSGEMIGIITTAAAISNTILTVPFAILADRYGRKRFVLWGMLSATLGYLLLTFTREPGWLIVATAVSGMGLAGGISGAVWTPAWTALLAEKASTQRRTSSFAWSQGVWTIALSSGSAMAVLPSLLQTSFHMPYLTAHEYLFLTMAVLSVLSGLMLIPLSEQGPHPPVADKTSKAQNRILPEVSLVQIMKFSVTLGMFGFASGVAVQLLSLWFRGMYGVNESILGPWFAAAEITSIIVVPIIPRMTKTWGSAWSVLATQGAAAILLGSMILAPFYQLAALLYVARNFLMNISWPVQQSYLMGTVVPKERASASAISSMLWGVGASAGTFLGGFLLGAGSYVSLSSPMLIGGAVYLASALIFFRLFRRIPPPEEEHIVT